MTPKNAGHSIYPLNFVNHRWTQIKCDMDEAWPPKTAGHSATLHG